MCVCVCVCVCVVYVCMCVFVPSRKVSVSQCVVLWYLKLSSEYN